MSDVSNASISIRVDIWAELKSWRFYDSDNDQKKETTCRGAEAFRRCFPVGGMNHKFVFAKKGIGGQMGSSIVGTWIYSTMLIENECGQRGTGFLVARAIDDKHGRGFLATNKHVLHKDAEMRQNATRVFLHLNIRNRDGSITGQMVELPLDLEDGSKRWREHPDRDVDVLAFDITPLLAEYPEIEKRCPDYSFFADRAKLEELDITIGDDIVVIGYPLGLRHRGTNFPLDSADQRAERSTLR